DLLARIRVKAPRPGVVVFDDPSSWLGKPVSLGEKVMLITGIHDTEMEAWVAIGDDIEFPKQAKITFFPNVDPLHPVVGEVRYLAYEALPRPNGTLAFRLRGTIMQTEKPRLGLKGTVRVDGDDVTLAYWLFRKPWALLRQTIGR
ncbi:MAG: HlyD family secretion protein, partial [Magnetococcales bacterium]|nr:HlyD family secretion protein [Magnetococcales bacterium]NGZ28686.1 HlyD family secretion protein [Magnetococcales bacterium]